MDENLICVNFMKANLDWFGAHLGDMRLDINFAVICREVHSRKAQCGFTSICSS